MYRIIADVVLSPAHRQRLTITFKIVYYVVLPYTVQIIGI